MERLCFVNCGLPNEQCACWRQIMRCADTDPMPYDQLDYEPSHGVVEMRGTKSDWSLDVTIEQGRAMEADGIPVYWIMKEADWPGGLG